MPTGYTPIYRVEKGGVDITSRFNDRTTEIKVELAAGNGETDKCMIKLDDRDWKIARPVPGDYLEIYLGYTEVGVSYMGSFEVDDVTFLGPPRSIQLTGLSTGMKSIMKAPAIKEFDNKTVGDILGSMAGSAGLGFSISSEMAAKTLPFKNQVVSNLHMIHELERLFGAVAKISDRKLIFVKRDGTTSASGISMPTLVLHPEHFGTWQVRYNTRSEYGNVKAAYRDKEDLMRKWVGNSASAGGQSNQGMEYMLGTLFNSKEEAEAAAQSKMESFRRSEVMATFQLAKGDPWVKDMQTLLVTGMRDGINGSYVIDKATHTYVKRSGIISSFDCKAPGSGADFSDRATEDFARPEPGELFGEYLKRLPEIYDQDIDPANP